MEKKKVNASATPGTDSVVEELVGALKGGNAFKNRRQQQPRPDQGQQSQQSPQSVPSLPKKVPGPQPGKGPIQPVPPPNPGLKQTNPSPPANPTSPQTKKK